MKKNFVVFPALVLGIAAMAHAQAPTKVAIIHVQNAILSTKDGQKAASELSTRFAPKKGELDKKQTEITGLQDQLRKGSATMSEDAKAKLMRDIDADNKSLQRETEDAQADLDQEQGKIMQELGNKVMAVIEKYATENGFALVLDVSNPADPRPVGRFGHRHHQRYREALRSGESGNRRHRSGHQAGGSADGPAHGGARRYPARRCAAVTEIVKKK